MVSWRGVPRRVRLLLMLVLVVLPMGGLALVMAAAQRWLQMVDVHAHARQSTLGGDTTVPLLLACVLILAP
jgi:uncharacterized membrane protein YidH (DUF202 family)